MKKIILLAFLSVLLSLTMLEGQFVAPLKAIGEPPIEVLTDYKLDRDIVFSGDGFIIKANDVVLDLNGHTISGSGTGKGVDFSLFPANWSGVTVKNGVIKHFERGISVYQSENSTIRNNTILNNEFGIFIALSRGIKLRENNMSENRYNLGVEGTSISHYLQDIDTSNLVDGKIVCFWINEMNRQVPLNAGYVAAINCSGIVVKNLNLTNNVEGVVFIYTTNSTTQCNSISNNHYTGIGIGWSTNNTIEDNIVTNDDRGGIDVLFSSNNAIQNNTIENNGYGICLGLSDNNTVCGNVIASNNKYWDPDFESAGMMLWESYDNRIYHNNLINNTNQVYYMYSDGSVNAWDDNYPSGGNFWSDYTGTDFFKGQYQDEAGSDGIGDTPYVIDPNNRDEYPLIVPLVWNYSNPIPVVWEGVTYPVALSSNSTVSTFQFNQSQMQMSFNVTGPTGTTGFCNVTFPNTLLWGEIIVLVDSNPPLNLTRIENATHISLYFAYQLQSTQRVQITGQYGVPEFPAWTSMLLILTVLTAAIAVYKRRPPKTPTH